MNAGSPVRVLLVEDDRGIAEPLLRGLAAHGYLVASATSGAEARSALDESIPDLVLLDLGLPDVDGVALCRELRARVPGTVIVILTARDAEVDVVVGLEAGADDYIVKPFRFSELLARLRAHLRRQAVLSDPAETGADPGEPAPAALRVGPVVLDLAARRCTIGGEPVELRPKEFALLEALLSEAGRAVTREQLMARVWDENWYRSTKTLDMHVGMLRRRLADHGESPDLITTLRGYGYRFETDRD
ncbi:MAG TPA: response regulator transcription factor [Mycobacteriales bacterium]|nr:response regulator transcription factor [Mycobacteriales bacterium]